MHGTHNVYFFDNKTITSIGTFPLGLDFDLSLALTVHEIIAIVVMLSSVTVDHSFYRKLATNSFSHQSILKCFPNFQSEKTYEDTKDNLILDLFYDENCFSLI